MPLRKTRAIVIRTQNLGEADKIVTFYTPYLGKVRAVARGARKPRSRLGGRLELVNYGELVFFERPNKNLHIINSFDTIETFSQLGDELTKSAYCFYIAELVGIVVSESGANPKTFQLLLNVLSAMGDVDAPELLIHAFALRLLALVGYRPELDRCVVCNNSMDKRHSQNRTYHKDMSLPVYFIASLGGVACRQCADRTYHKDMSLLSQGSRAMMKSIQTANFANISRFRASKQNYREIRSVISAFIAYHFEKKIKSWELIDDVVAG